MSSGPTPLWRGSTAPTPDPSGPSWRAAPVRRPYRPRWRRLALVGTLALAALAAATWTVFWIRPPEPARIVLLSASYDRTLAVPPNPYAKHDVRELTSLTRPGSWLGTRSRMVGGPTSALTRSGLPDLTHVREKCVVVYISAHGGRDREGPFLFPEDCSGEAAERVRVKTLLNQLARLPADRQKLLILDATHASAFTEVGLVINDFAAGVEEMDAEIAAVPNLVVLLSSGLDERSWVVPEFGRSVFTHFMLYGLNGAADADGNQRVTAGELADFIVPRVSDWARDNRGARQVPVLLPKNDGVRRARAMHLVSVDRQPSPLAAPEPFEAPPELEEQWKEYRELARSTPPPIAYTPHLWRQYETWVLRYEELILANDSDGAKVARANAADARRKIQAARKLEISPQTLTIQAAVGGQPFTVAVPEVYKSGIESLAREPAASRAKLWASLRAAASNREDSSLLWCRALIDWVALDPVERLPVALELIPLVGDGFALRPAELNFLSMLGRHLPPTSGKEAVGPRFSKVLQERLKSERAAAGLEPNGSGRLPTYPYAEFVYPWAAPAIALRDKERRNAEDLCFATDVQSTEHHAVESYVNDAEQWTRDVRQLLAAWHREAHQLPALGEWLARESGTASFAIWRSEWSYVHMCSSVLDLPPGTRADWIRNLTLIARDHPDKPAFTNDYALKYRELLNSRMEIDTAPAARTEAVKWWHAAEAALTAPLEADIEPGERIALIREFRRVSRQLLVISQTRSEPLSDVSGAKAREIAFEAAARRATWLMGRLGETTHFHELLEIRPGENVHDLYERIRWFSFRADGRQSLAIFGSRCGELFEAAAELARKPDRYREADRWVRISPAHAPVTDAPIHRTRRERVRGYLAWQAQRTFADHWYGEGSIRYYHLAIQKLASDANAIVAAFPPTDDPFKPLLGPETPFPVVPSLPKRIAITDEPQPEVRVHFTANATPGVEGYVVFWTDPNRRVQFETAIVNGGWRSSLTRPAPLAPLTPKAQTEAFKMSGFFRGRLLDASVPVDFFAVPDSAVVSTPLPPTASLALRADPRMMKQFGLGSGAVAIVLDCSGSMARDPNDPASVGFYQEAVAACAKLLRGLPPGTTITIWSFGQRTPGARAAEATIRELLLPTELPLDPEPMIEDVMRIARGLEPWHESPITRAAVTAKNRITKVKVPFKAVVLLSDMVDNRFAVDPDYGEKKRTIGDVLRSEFPPEEVAFGVVAFPVGKAEQSAQAEFRIVEKLVPAGKFVTPEKLDDLLDWLRTGLNARVRFTLEPLDSDSPRPGVLMAGTAETDNWYSGKFMPGRYRLRVVGSNLASDITLSPGQNLLLELLDDRGSFLLRRHWYADSVPAVAKAGASAGPWRLALLQNRARNDALDLFALIEGNPADANRLSPTRIADAWFDVTPQVPDAPPAAIRWHAEGGFPAPAWSVTSPGWPRFPGIAAPASPRLTAWWAQEPFVAGGEWKAPDKGMLGVLDREVSLSGSKITLDSVRLEEHEVEIAPGERVKRLCLVVRITHAAGEPVYARVQGADPAMSEVRVYRSANRTTTIFWWPGLSAESIKAKVSGLEFVALAEALRAAEKAGRHLTLPAPAPTETSERPQSLTK